MADRTLKFKVVGDASSAKAALKDTEDGLGRFGVAGDKAHATLSNFTGKLDSFGPIGQKASSTLKGMVGGLESIPVPAVAAVGAVGAIGVGIEKMAATGVAKFQSLAGEVRQFSRASGASAVESSKFVALGDRYGVTADTMSSAVFKLGINVDKHADKLRAAGIEVAKNADGTTNLTATLLNVSDAYNKSHDPAQKAGIAFAAFGKAGASLIPILSKTKGEIDDVWAAAARHHEILTDADLKKAADFKKAQYELGQAFGGMERELGSAVIPTLTRFATTATTALEQVDALAQHVGGLQHFVTGFVDSLPGIGPAATVMGLFGGKTKDAGDAAKTAAPDVASLGDAAAKIVDPADAAKTALSALNDAFDKFIGVNISAEQADIRFRDALDAVTASVKQHGTTLDLNTDAGRRNREAIDSVITASTDHLQAMAKAGSSSSSLTAQWNAEKTAILDKMRALGLDSTAIANYKAELDSIPAAKFTKISAEIDKANAARDWENFLHDLKNRLDLTVNIHRTGPVVFSTSADGAVMPTVRGYAAGGENHVAQIAQPGEWRIWAEPETGGEAYIPLAPSKRGRSKAILSDVANRFGMHVMADGGASGSSSVVGRGGGVHITIQGGTYVGPGGIDEFVRMLRSKVLKGLGRGDAGLA